MSYEAFLSDQKYLNTSCTGIVKLHSLPWIAYLDQVFLIGIIETAVESFREYELLPKLLASIKKDHIRFCHTKSQLRIPEYITILGSQVCTSSNTSVSHMASTPTTLPQLKSHFQCLNISFLYSYYVLSYNFSLTVIYF